MGRFGRAYGAAVAPGGPNLPALRTVGSDGRRRHFPMARLGTRTQPAEQLERAANPCLSRFGSVSRRVDAAVSRAVAATGRYWPNADARAAQIPSGGALLPEGQKKRRLAEATKAMLRDELGGRVFAFDSDAADALAMIVRARARKGKPIDFQDACIAAICKARGATIVTRNRSGFEGTGIAVVDPWASERN